jgi:hypothetical protein
VPELQGRYFFADFGTSNLGSFVWDGSAQSAHDGTNFADLNDHSLDPAFDPDVGTIDAVSSFGEDDLGNVYILDYIDGELYRLPEPAWPLGLAAGGLALGRLGARRRRR